MFSLKRSYTFANLMTEKPFLICYNKNLRKTPEEERNFKKRPESLLTISL